MYETMRTFHAGRFTVRAMIEPDYDVDLSWDETGETAEKLNCGEFQCFQTKVAVELDGREIAADYLGGSIYADPREFFTDHRSVDPMNRNCSIMRAERGERAVICHYFPDMVRTAIGEAREALRHMQSVKVRAAD